MTPESLVKLASANLSSEQMKIVLEILAVELKSSEELRLEQERQASLRRERNHRYYEIKRLNRVLKDAEQDADKTQKKVSPYPFKENTTSNLTVESSSPLCSPQPSLQALFAEFWAVYPKRAGNTDKAAAFKAYGPALKRASHETIVNGARAYAAFCAATGKTKTEFVRQARTWLNQSNWQEDYHAPAPAINSREASFALINAAIDAQERREAEAGYTEHAEDVAPLPRLRQVVG